jgi:hypothetical protein
MYFIYKTRSFTFVFLINKIYRFTNHWDTWAKYVTQHGRLTYMKNWKIRSDSSLVGGLSRRTTGLDPRPFQIRFTVRRAALEPVLFQVIQFPPVTVVPQFFRTHILIHLQSTLHSKILLILNIKVRFYLWLSQLSWIANTTDFERS